MPLSYVKKDIRGKGLDSLMPDIGAYEYENPLNDLSLQSILTSLVQPCGSDSTALYVVI